jgi:2-keto-4-pentenoate hydratase/2-oxohepta-3-ene-1,7-dioic acid hydratase in catechol pathway
VGPPRQRATPIRTDADGAELLADRAAIDAAAAAGDRVHDREIADLALLSPVTTPCRVVAQMVNYRSHAKESGFDPGKVSPTFFRKASGSVVGPTDDVVAPAHVRLLDYEVELGLVMGPRSPWAPRSRQTLGDYVAGLSSRTM